MHVLHAHWHFPTVPTETGGMLFWAESSTTTPLKKQKGRTGKTAHPHPFCASPATTEKLLQTLVPFLDVDQFHQLTLLLPSLKSTPIPSPQLLHDWEIDQNKEAVLVPWLVAGVWFSPVAAFRLLSQLPSLENLPAEVALGPDVRYWQLAGTLILETLAQQKVLPTLAQIELRPRQKLFHARWLPILDGANDGPRLAHLIEAMPPLCRAEATNPEQAPPPRRVLETYLNTTTDALMRFWGRAKLPAYLSPQQDSAHAWLAALFAHDPQVTAAPAQLEHLSKSHQNWLRNLHVAGDKTFRVAFRLQAPTQQSDNGDGHDWRLHFLLQARDDPSLLVPAQEVWKSKGNTLNALNRRFEQPREKLLAGLGYAANRYEPLREGLKTATPTNLALTTQQAFTFLRESAPILEASGFGVLVPPWWNKPGTRLGVRLTMSSGSKTKTEAEASGRISFDKLVRYRWELSLGDTALTHEEFEALVKLKSPLVQIRGQWVQLDPEQIEAAINFWKKQNLEAEVDLQEAMRLGLGATDSANGLPIEEVEFEGWLKEWMEKFTGGQKLSLLEPPAGLHADLRPYQQYGYAWLNFLREWGMGACLADDMGLGKTIQTIALILQQKEALGRLPAPVLIICPTSVVVNWAREIARFAPGLTSHIHQGADRLREEEFIKQAKATDMVLTSYAIARRDAETLQKIDWYSVILDEAQNIKNPEAKQTRAIRSLPADFRLALTGTPVENRLTELWSIMNFLNPGFLGSRSGFRQSFARPIERYGDEQATHRLKKMVGPFILRRVKTDPTVIQDLPDKQEMKVYCNLSEEQATLYESVVQEAMEQVAQADGIQRRGLVLSMLMKLKQICNHPAQFLHQISAEQQADMHRETSRSGKLERLTEMLDEAISVEDRVLIFTQFAEMGHFLKSHVQQTLGVPALFLHGGTPAKKRGPMVERFQDDPHGPPIFILSLKAGGTGLNLTRASHVFHFDRWWNPAVENQATDRAFRIGQKQNVQVHKFVCVGTLEEQIDEMIESKKALAESVVGSGEGWLTEVSTDDLRDLVTLRREVIR
ncbi:MAG: DEAD/DEAH box helicase [Anaerolineae bacterium]|nr:DEAD/DEAH box helicase [Anaerolineae bacterium]